VYSAYSDFVYDVLWVVESLGQPTPLLGGPIESSDGAPNWSPDAARIAFQRWDHGERSELWVIDADGSNPRLLTAANDASLSAPLWAPDGSVLVFFRDGQLWRMLPDGTSMAPVTDSYAVAASWSPSVTFGGPSSSPLRLAISEASGRIVLVGLDGSGRTVLANGTNAHWR
jgi:Tol biopolymer transport system component